jgi:hypothetical protein
MAHITSWSAWIVLQVASPYFNISFPPFINLGFVFLISKMPRPLWKISLLRWFSDIELIIDRLSPLSKYGARSLFQKDEVLLELDFKANFSEINVNFVLFFLFNCENNVISGRINYFFYYYLFNNKDGHGTYHVVSFSLKTIDA